VVQTLRTIDEHGQTGENIKTGQLNIYITMMLNAKKNTISISGSSDDG
jgi:hypothetical protein